DAAQYVPRELFEYWRARDPIARFEEYLVREKQWLTARENEKLIADVEAELERDREAAVNSPMPDPKTTPLDIFCNGCHQIQLKYGTPKYPSEKKTVAAKRGEAAVHLK
ncbi:MAG TPA: thiamine pyrophosphate-dependent enzyme, partial [Terriglobales bacterium]|nr:thiamine pyrophosphate-dependent enzyme [Terriglobales bacterium]